MEHTEICEITTMRISLLFSLMHIFACLKIRLFALTTQS